MSYSEINLGDVILSFTKYDSKRELETVLKKYKQNLLLDSECGGEISFLLKASASGEKWNSRCGLVFNGPLNPQIAPHNEGYRCWIGFDSCVFLVSLFEPECIAEVELPCVFYSFVIFEPTCIIAVHELGAVCLNSSAEKIWEISTSDILTDYYIEGNCLYLKSDDGKVISHDLKS